MIPNKNAENIITREDVNNTLNLSLSGKKRIIDWSRPKKDITAIKLNAEINAVFIPTSCCVYILAAIIQKTNPKTAPVSRDKSI